MVTSAGKLPHKDQSHLKIATVSVAMQNSVVKNKGQMQKASGPKVADWQYVGIEKFTRRLVWN